MSTARIGVGRRGLLATTMLYCASAVAPAQAQQAVTPLPPVHVDEPHHRAAAKPKPKPATRTAATTARRAARRTNAPSAPAAAPAAGAGAQTAARDGSGGPFGDQLAGAPLQQTATLSKTGTKLADIPGTAQVIPRQLLDQQADTTLNQAVLNAAGVAQGGQDTLGYFDHFLIRGLNAQVYQDGFSDGDQLGGLSHSLNGVRRVEVLSGPGSALFGSGPPGGTINIVHYQPSPDFHWGTSVIGGSFGSITSSSYVTGPTTIPGLNYRVDATLQRADGFRDLRNNGAEIRPDFLWTVNDHIFEVSLDARTQHQTPDSYGLIYFLGTPVTGVPIDAKYSTPFAFADSTYLRPVISDKWLVNDVLTINNRFAYTNRTLNADRNGDSTRTIVCLGNGQKDPVTNLPCLVDSVVGRQLRQQSDLDNTYDYQFEPVWHFGTGPMQHTLLTGFEAVRQTMETQRTTADLPNIASVFAPVPPELSTNGLVFKCDASHSCDNDQLAATYLSLYATDQVDVGEKLRVRAGIRQDLWDTTLNPLITVPGRFTSTGVPIVAGEPLARHDQPVSWNVGALYHVFPWFSPYVGVSKSYLTNFNSENTQNGIGAPESALQYEAGIKFGLFNDRITLTTAVYDVSRDNVAAAVTLNGVEQVVFDAQRTKGAEAILDAQITDHWRLLANASAQQAIITSNPQALSSVGNHPQGVPAYMANLWSIYNFSVAGVPGFQIGGGLNYRDRTYSDITNVNSVPSFLIFNAMVGYQTPVWSVALNVKNITNQRYFIAANAAGALVGDPLSALLTLRVKM